MRRALVAALTVVVVACSSNGGTSSSSSSGVPPSTLPGDLVPASAASATVRVSAGGAAVTVAADVVARTLPLLVRRVFDAREPLASYGLDPPRATITFSLVDGSTIVLSVGSQEFDSSARYVRRGGDDRIWLVLNQSLDPLFTGVTVPA